IGAVSTIDGTRRRNTARLARYLESLGAGRRPPAELEEIDELTRLRERLMLRLRLDVPVELGDAAGVVDAVALERLRGLGLVERPGFPVSSSTVRSELAELEQLGLLTHPHTSAGRIPTERGYRLFAAELLERTDARPRPFELDLSALRSEVDSALQATSERL